MCSTKFVPNTVWYESLLLYPVRVVRLLSGVSDVGVHHVFQRIFGRAGTRDVACLTTPVQTDQNVLELNREKITYIVLIIALAVFYRLKTNDL